MLYIAPLGRFALGRIWYAGISLDGAVVATRDALNNAYYDTEVTPTDILIRRAVTNPQSAGLIEAIGKVAGGQYATGLQSFREGGVRGRVERLSSSGAGRRRQGPGRRTGSGKTGPHAAGAWVQ
jgi:hypothetical protein